MSGTKILGVDVGASGIKGAIVDSTSGELLTDRLRLDTPQPATPVAMTKVFTQLVQELEWNGPIGVGFPTIVVNGVAKSAANIDPSWIGTDIGEAFGNACGCQVNVVNDADAAGIAEVKLGKGAGVPGVVLLITIGSGLGSALFVDGQLVPNTEFGHLLLHNMKAEHYAASSIRKRDNLSWEVWGKRLNEYLQHINRLLTPQLILLGGGISKRFEEFEPYLDIPTKVTPAKFLNKAGIIGAALSASHLLEN